MNDVYPSLRGTFMAKVAHNGRCGIAFCVNWFMPPTFASMAPMGGFNPNSSGFENVYLSRVAEVCCWKRLWGRDLAPRPIGWCDRNSLYGSSESKNEHWLLAWRIVSRNGADDESMQGVHRLFVYRARDESRWNPLCNRKSPEQSDSRTAGIYKWRNDSRRGVALRSFCRPCCVRDASERMGEMWIRGGGGCGKMALPP